MHKYQFYISFNDKPHTASSKAIQDCSLILARLGYSDYTVYTTITTDKRYLSGIVKNIFRLFFFVKPKSIVAIQYPLLSGNGLFKYFIKALRLKKVKFFCVIHDLDSLRYQTPDLIVRETQNLNYYDCLIVHNDIMQAWLMKHGVTAPMIPLQLFDYLTEKMGQEIVQDKSNQQYKRIVFAGNLSKSTFIYALGTLSDWQFNLYGPNFVREKGERLSNARWCGSFSPEEIITEMDGAFGLIWDGAYIDQLDDQFGSYLKFNNPHKLSLYLAAGLPVIAPAASALAGFIKKQELGILVNSLMDLKDIEIDPLQYERFKTNALKTGEKIKKGDYFTQAIFYAENILANGSGNYHPNLF